MFMRNASKLSASQDSATIMISASVPQDADASFDRVLEAISSASGAAGPVSRWSQEGGRVRRVSEDARLDAAVHARDPSEASGDDSGVLEALKTLVFDGEGDGVHPHVQMVRPVLIHCFAEVAENFKQHGNSLYVQKSYRDALDAYTSGINAAPTTMKLRIDLLSNRAACNLALKNYRAVLTDVGLVITLCTAPQLVAAQAKGVGGEASTAAESQTRVPVPIKAMWRAAQALVALERWREARDVIDRGTTMAEEKDKAAWAALDAQVKKGVRTVEERKERIRREGLTKAALRKAIVARGLVTVNTPSPPDNPHPPHFDPESLPPQPPLYEEGSSEAGSSWTAPDESTPVIFPVFLLYPAHSQSDLITQFNETNSLDDHLSVMFPSSPADTSGPGWCDWDTNRNYWTGNLNVYMETAGKRLLKVGKELSLREVMAKAVKVGEDGTRDGMALRDGLLSFVVLAKGQAEKQWIDEFKRNRDAAK